MHQAQQQQQREQLHQQQQSQSKGMGGGNRNDLGGPNGQQYTSGPSQIGSPASPAYSSGASPFATPIPQHTPMPPPPNNNGISQASPPATFVPPSQPNRSVSNASVGKGRAGAGATKAPPATSNVGSAAVKRTSSGSTEDPSPRNRKRARGGAKEDAGEVAAAASAQGPETPRFDGSGPSSPALSVSGIPSQSVSCYSIS